jgi:DNA-binding transcriptional LysR family regulator
MSALNVSIEQWRSLNAVVETGGFASAAEKLHRSQSSISYHVARLQEQLGIRVLKIVGRKAELTEHGRVIYRRSQQLLREAERLDELARSLDQGWEASISLVVDTAFPTQLLMKALRIFEPLSRGSRVQLEEVVLSGAEDALLDGTADLAIAARAPAGFLGDFLIPIDFIAVAHPQHALHQLKRRLNSADLEKELQVVIRDSGLASKMDVGWLGAEHQWTVSKMETAVAAISSGLGFGWLPEHAIDTLLKDNQLKPLALNEGQRYHASLQLIFGDSEHAGPATRQLAEIIRQVVIED